MSIQGSLNQALGIGAALYTQTPGYAVKKEEKLKQNEIKKLESKVAGYDKQIKDVNPNHPQAESTTQSLEAGKASLEKKLIMLDPSNERLSRYYEAEAIRRQEANYRAAGKKANRQNQKQTMNVGGAFKRGK